MGFKRVGARVAFVIAIVMVLSGCGKLMSTPEPVTIRFTHPSAEQAYYEVLAQQFEEENSYITMELLPRDERGMRSLIASGGVDVFVATQFDAPWLRSQDRVLNLKPFIEQFGSVSGEQAFNLDDFYPGTVGLFSSEGRIWAIPRAVDVMVMYYNKDLFDRYNVPYPQVGWTWNDFLDRALALRDPGAGVYAYAPLYTGDYQFYDVVTYMYQHGGQIFDDLQAPTRTTFDDPLNVEALTWYVNLLYKHDVAPTLEEAEQFVDYPLSGIAQGQFAMWKGLFSERGGEDDAWLLAWDVHWGMAPLSRDQNAATLAMTDAYFVSAGTEHPDECWQWVAFLSEQLPARQIPPRRSLAESDAYVAQVGDDVAAVARASLESAMLFSPRVFEFEDEIEALGQGLYAAVNGDLPPQDALSMAQEQAESR